MQITIRSTNQVTTANGVPVRVWEGVTGGGTPCLVLVQLLCVRSADDTAQFDRELKELPAPREVSLANALGLVDL